MTTVVLNVQLVTIYGSNTTLYVVIFAYKGPKQLEDSWVSTWLLIIIVDVVYVTLAANFVQGLLISFINAKITTIWLMIKRIALLLLPVIYVWMHRLLMMDAKLQIPTVDHRTVQYSSIFKWIGLVQDRRMDQIIRFTFYSQKIRL